ncbi:MAG: hypothetical protein WCK47_09125 [bacterium]
MTRQPAGDEDVVTEPLTRIYRLIDRVTGAAYSRQNHERLARTPRAVFQMENPIAWTAIFGYDVNRYLTDPQFYVEQTLTQMLWRWENFSDDAMPLTLELPAWLGHYPEYTFVGLGVEFNGRGVPIIQADHPLTRHPDLDFLKPVCFESSGWMPRILRWHEDIAKIVDGRMKVVFNMVWWRGCLDLAVQLRGYENLMSDAAERPEFVHGLLEFLTAQRCSWHAAFTRHFGRPLEPADIGDDWINVPFITPRFFAEFVLPRYLELEAFHGGVSHIHSCGNQAPVQKHLLEIRGLMEFEVSPWTSLTETLDNIPVDKLLVISLHPNDVLCAQPARMKAQLLEIARGCAGRAWRVQTSGLTPLTPDTAEFVERVRVWTSIARSLLQHDHIM